VLSLPYVLRLNGWVIGVLFILVGAFAAGWGLYMIAESAIKANVKNFSKLANHVGDRALELFLQINVLFILWGICVSYQIVLSSLIAKFL
jgi:amino acid permease